MMRKGELKCEKEVTADSNVFPHFPIFLLLHVLSVRLR